MCAGAWRREKAAIPGGPGDTLPQPLGPVLYPHGFSCTCTADTHVSSYFPTLFCDNDRFHPTLWRRREVWLTVQLTRTGSCHRDKIAALSFLERAQGVEGRKWKVGGKRVGRGARTWSRSLTREHLPPSLSLALWDVCMLPGHCWKQKQKKEKTRMHKKYIYIYKTFKYIYISIHIYTQIHIYTHTHVHKPIRAFYFPTKHSPFFLFLLSV